MIFPSPHRREAQHARPRNGRLKQALGAASLLVASIAASCLLGEFVLRSFMKDRIVLFPRYQTSATYGEFTLRRFRPNATFKHTSVDGTWQFRTNSAGLRADVDHSYERAPHVTRIVALGDSHTAGHEVDQQRVRVRVERVALERPDRARRDVGEVQRH